MERGTDVASVRPGLLDDVNSRIEKHRRVIRDTEQMMWDGLPPLDLEPTRIQLRDLVVWRRWLLKRLEGG